MREQFTRGGAITETMHAAVQRDEAEPRRELRRAHGQHSDSRHSRMNEKFWQRIRNDPMFRRYSGLIGRDPTREGGDKSKADQVAPWNWINVDDVPPPQNPDAGQREADVVRRNTIVDNHLGS
eukprot:2470405-Alexandrium_andersonii.AAC.1